MREELDAEIERMDLMLLGGGGILYDHEAESYLRLVRFAQDAGVTTATYAVGAGPLERPADRAAVAAALNEMRLVTVREKAAKRLLEECGVEREICVTADPALLLEAEPFTPQMLEREGLPGGRRLIGMSVREAGSAMAELEAGEYHALLANAADFMADRFDAHVVFVPLERKDIRESHRVIGRMATPEDASVLRRSYGPRELRGLMEHLDMAVGMRLHFLLFAVTAGVPVAALPYATKVRDFLESLDVRSPDPEQLGARRRAAVAHRSPVGSPRRADRAGPRAPAGACRTRRARTSARSSSCSSAMPPLQRPEQPAQVTLPARRATIAARPDVVVVGGGPAGIGAAVGAAHAGADVVLVERYGFLGGNATVALVMPLMSWHNEVRGARARGDDEPLRLLPTDHGPGEPVVAGALLELMQRLLRPRRCDRPERGHRLHGPDRPRGLQVGGARAARRGRRALPAACLLLGRDGRAAATPRGSSSRRNPARSSSRRR